ncbi:MAG: membrane dipeptidase [Deltaproteobacteria bacterium]|nr:membrane dipeptidase [Deltaproteobacteria bacterium]
MLEPSHEQAVGAVLNRLHPSAWWLWLVLGMAWLGCAREGPEAASHGVNSATTASAAAASQPSPGVTRSGAVALAPSAAASSAAPPPPPPPLVTLPTEGPFGVIDLHVDTPWKVHFKDRPLSLPEGHATPALLKQGHYAGIVFVIYIPDYLHGGHPTIADADAILETLDKLIASHDHFVAASAGPVPAGKLAVFKSIEGAGAFADDITQIDRFIEQGIRLVGLAHNHDNRLVTASTLKKGGKGLTELGTKFCQRVYAAGALVDVSHMSDAGFADLVPIAMAAGAPIVASHSNARALCKHKRNLTDEQLKLIGATGGVAGVNLYRHFVSGGTAKLSHVVAQVEHMVEVAGVDHVAIGSDFDGGTPVGALSNTGKLQVLAEALREAGFSDADVRKIFGENALRVLTWQPKPR